jgi:hypothetical protein
LTAIPFMGVLVLGMLAQTLRSHRHEPECHAPNTRVSAYAFAGTLIVAGFVTARTWLLTGMPTIGPDVLFHLWSALGLHLRDPVGTLEWTWPQDWPGLPGLLVDWLFRPQTMPHIVITWPGNFWLWFAALAIAASLAGRGIARRERPVWPLVAMAATAFVLATAIGYRERGGDGNYFLAGLVPGILLAANAAFARSEDSTRRAMLACLPAFALFQATYSFVSAGWTPGTRAFDVVLEGRRQGDGEAVELLEQHQASDSDGEVADWTWTFSTPGASVMNDLMSL